MAEDLAWFSAFLVTFVFCNKTSYPWTNVRIFSDSRKGQVPKWLSRLQILDSITLFSNLIFKGVGRHPKTRNADQRHGDGGHHRHLPQTMGDIAALQATQAELSTEELLWGECQCYKDIGLGDAYCQPSDCVDSLLYR